MSERYVPIPYQGSNFDPDQSDHGCASACSLYSRLYAFAQVTRRPNFKEMSQDYARCQRWLNKKRFKAFYTSVFADNLRHGTQFLLQVGSSDCTNWFLFCSDHLKSRFHFSGSWSGSSKAKHDGHGFQKQLEGWGHEGCGDLYQHDTVCDINIKFAPHSPEWNDSIYSKHLLWSFSHFIHVALSLESNWCLDGFITTHSLWSLVLNGFHNVAVTPLTFCSE